jgi:guanine deaminase
MIKTRARAAGDFMLLAVAEARRGVDRNEGGPFGAVIVRRGRIIARAHNRVIKTHDPTAHAEILAIRKASRTLGRFDLSECELYTTCEPCPMCLAAAYWAKIRRLFYGCTRQDAARIRFDDRYIYQVIRGRVAHPRLRTVPFERDACLPLFRAWDRKTDKVRY